MSQDLLTSFELLLFGWGGVFVVILIIYFASLLLSKLFPVKIKKALYVYLKRIWLQKIRKSFAMAKLITHAGLAVGEEVAYTVGILTSKP